MLIVVTNITKSDFCENIFLSFYKPNHLILRDQIVDLFDIFRKIYISGYIFQPTLLFKHVKQKSIKTV